MSRFPALEHPEFRRYFIGQAIALIGGFAHNVGMAWLAYRLTGSVALLGVVGFAQLSPALLVSPLAGLLADRYPRRAMLIGLLGAVALTGLLLAALTAAGWMNPALLVVFAFVRGLLFAIEIPIRHAFLVDLIEDRAVLPNAVALHSSALNTARFIGPAIGGVLIGWAGEAACFLLHPFLLCATLYQLMRIRTVSRDAPRPKGSFGQQFIEGWRCAFDDPVIARMLIGVFALGFGVGPYAHLMPAAVAALHGAHPELVGLFLSSAGVGAMIAAISLAVRRGSRNLQMIALAGNLSAAIGLAVFTRTDLLALAMGAMVLVGLGTIAQAVSTNVTIQQRVDDDKRGRVMAIYTAMFIGATPLGSLFFGQLGAWVGAPDALLAGAVLGLAGAALTAWRQRA
jgi:MFS family permease